MEQEEERRREWKGSCQRCFMKSDRGSVEGLLARRSVAVVDFARIMLLVRSPRLLRIDSLLYESFRVVGGRGIVQREPTLAFAFTPDSTDTSQNKRKKPGPGELVMSPAYVAFVRVSTQLPPRQQLWVRVA